MSINSEIELSFFKPLRLKAVIAKAESEGWVWSEDGECSVCIDLADDDSDWKMVDASQVKFVGHRLETPLGLAKALTMSRQGLTFDLYFAADSLVFEIANSKSLNELPRVRDVNELVMSLVAPFAKDNNFGLLEFSYHQTW